MAEKTALLRPVELKFVPVALEGSAFRTKVLDKDELLGYTSLIAVWNIYIFVCMFICQLSLINCILKTIYCTDIQQ